MVTVIGGRLLIKLTNTWELAVTGAHIFWAVDYDNEDLLDINCIDGHTGCLMDDALFSHIGEVSNANVCEFFDDKNGKIILNKLSVRGYLGNIALMLATVITGTSVCLFYFCVCIKRRLSNCRRFKYDEITPLL